VERHDTIESLQIAEVRKGAVLVCVTRAPGSRVKGTPALAWSVQNERWNVGSTSEREHVDMRKWHHDMTGQLSFRIAPSFDGLQIMFSLSFLVVLLLFFYHFHSFFSFFQWLGNTCFLCPIRQDGCLD
jgi:hypothetical protein